jgi:ABC-2 type transport system permease protein
MKALAAEGKIYLKYLRMHLLSGMEYKGWWLMLLQVLFVVVTDPLSTVLMFSRFGPMGPWTVERIILVYALAVASFGLAECLLRGFDYFPWYMIRTGDFDRLLLRPRSLFTQVAASFFHLHRAVRPVTGICAAIWALNTMAVPLTAANALVLASALLGGFVLYCGVFVLTSGLAFFTIKGLDWIYILTNASYQITRCPEPYMPKALKGMFTFLMPVMLVSFYPAATVCGWGYPLWLGYIALPSGMLFMGLSLIVWRIGVRHYKSTGS